MFSILRLNEMEKWDTLVKSFADYDIYYLSSYVKGLELHGDGEPLLFYYQTNGLRAMTIAMKRDIASSPIFKGQIEANRFFDLITPYGYGGFIFEGDFNEQALRDLEEAYTSFCSKIKFVSELVRLRPFSKNLKLEEAIYKVRPLGKTVTIILDTSEQIWQDLSSTRRRVIRKAVKQGVTVYWGRSPEMLETFIALYQATMLKDKATDYYYFGQDFYASVLEDLKHHLMFFYAEYKGEVIASAMILFANHRMHYHLSGAKVAYNHLSPTSCIIYEAACWGSENGYHLFHLGGGLASREDELYRFKKNFNKHSNTSFAIGQKIFDEDVYQELLSIRNQTSDQLPRENFFPSYRS